MSTTFNVYPTVPEIPSFHQLLQRADSELHRFLNSIGVSNRPHIEVCIQYNDDHRPLSHDISSPLVWPEKTYAWFFIESVLGGTDAYFERYVSSEDRSDLLNKGNRADTHKDMIALCARQDHYWSFRRSVGQPALVNLCYGLLAGSLADLTSGLVSSFDSAWDYDLMPMTGNEFLAQYFVPALTADRDDKEWAEEGIARIREHFLC